MKITDGWAGATPVFDDTRLIGSAGLLPVLGLAQRTGLHRLVGERVSLGPTRVRSAGVNPVGKVTAIVAGMAAGAECIDDLDVIRSGGMARVCGGVYACATLGQFLREFTHGHVSQLGAVLREHLVELTRQTPSLLPGLAEQAYVDIDSLLRPVYGHAKQGASYGHTKVAGKQVLRRGLSPLLTTLSTPTGAPVIVGARLRAGRAGSGRGAGSMVRSAIRTARAAGATGPVLVRGDAAYGSKSVVWTCLDNNAQFSLVLTRNSAVDQTIAAIPETAWTTVRYPGAVTDPDTGELISDAQVAEIGYTAFAGSRRPVTARLIVRRVRDANTQDALFPVWRYHPFFTNSTAPTPTADIVHRQHAIIETVNSDLIDGPLARIPSGSFPANAAWLVCAAITHNLLRAAGTLAGGRHAVARGATLRRQLIHVPARLAQPQRRPWLHLPAHWPWATDWSRLWQSAFHPRALAPPGRA